MLLISLLCCVMCSADISPELMREVLRGGQDRQVPHVYGQLEKIFALTELGHELANTARPFVLQPSGTEADCTWYSHAQFERFRALGAQLHVYLPQLAQGKPGDKVSVMVKRPLPLGVREDHFVLSWSEDWVQLNVSQSIHELSYWLKQGLCLSATVNGVRPQEMPDLDQSDYLPFLIVWTAERLSLPPTKMRRSSRRDRFRETALDNGGGRNKAQVRFPDRCTMQPLYVDFRDLGWEGWIIAPAGLDIGSCVGGCVREEYPPHSNYNLVVDAIGRDPNLQRLYEISGLRTERCCVPTKQLPSVIMFIDSRHNIVVQLVEGILVGACGCL